MKKFLLITGLLVLSFGMSFGQTISKQIAFGAKGVDSIAGAATKYYYFSTTQKISDYQIYAIQAYVSRSVITGSDSTEVTFEVSVDGTNWHKFTWTTAKVTGGATYWSTRDVTNIQAAGATLLIPSTCYFPYVRVKFQHYKAACNVYPKAYIVLKKL